jgi:membrane protease YdiL (CAAX protease family)
VIPGILVANAGEEIGWRGFAFPHLLDRLRPLPASLLFGVIWATLHLPLYLQVPQNFAVLVPMLMARGQCRAAAVTCLEGAWSGSAPHAIVDTPEECRPGHRGRSGISRERGNQGA